uniref:Uncharacterized protein n=1 Tax=Mesocestoides corti TaxID=53468 RepID=A0A5K3FB67_MESCO
MKTNIDFGILPSRTTPLGRKSTHASTELVLNNEACVGAAACPRHYCVADVARKSLPPPTHPRHHSPQLPSPPPAVLLKSSTVDASELRDASAPTHIIASFDCPPPQRFIEVAKPPASRSHTQAIPLNENPLCVSASHPQMEILTTQHRKLAAWKTWLTRVGLFLAVALVVICFIYQICAWGSRWHKRRSVYLLKRTPITATTSTQTHLSLVDPDIVNVTICNANPFRGSAIFELPSGSYLYDALTGVRTGTMRVPQFAKELSKQSIATLLTISHHLPDMLRRCTINGVICGPEQFTNVLNLNRLCFRLPLNSS